MARFFSYDQEELLRSPHIKANILLTMYMDEGPIYLCDDVEDLTDGALTFIGANVLFSAGTVEGSGPLTAEPVTITLDGNRLYNAGVDDPGVIIDNFLNTKYHQRRVDFDYGFMYPESQLIQLIVPAFAGKINHAKLIHPESTLGSGDPTFPKLEIVLDSLAVRYNRATYRIRNHDDQLQLAPGDLFYSYTTSAFAAESTLYWGKKAPGGTGNSSYRPGAPVPQIGNVIF